MILAVLAGAGVSTLLWATFGNEYAGFLARPTPGLPSSASNTVGADDPGHSIPADSSPAADTPGPVASPGAGDPGSDPGSAVAETPDRIAAGDAETDTAAAEANSASADPMPARSDPAPESTEPVPAGGGVIPTPPAPVVVSPPRSAETDRGTGTRDRDPAPVQMSVPATPLEARVAAEVAMARYAGAVESADLEALRAAHPWITREHEAAWRGVFARAGEITTELWIAELSVDDVDARVEIRGICTYTDSRRRTRTDLPMAVTMFLHHDGLEWRPVLASGPDDLPALPPRRLVGGTGPTEERRSRRTHHRSSPSRRTARCGSSTRHRDGSIVRRSVRR